MRIIACMSGTSLDGLDLALCEFNSSKASCNFEILACETIAYDDELRQRLSTAHLLSAIDFVQLEHDLSALFTDMIFEFIAKNHISDVDYIASHGHTVFHQPQKGFTKQIGNGLQMAQGLGIPVVYDFRSLDVFNGGQGAPLVPIGDQLLFSDYDYCLNLGGFSNVSYSSGEQRIAFDISPVNIVLNALSHKLGQNYDDKGKVSRSGTLIPSLYDEFNTLTYYQESYPKSLGKEWVEQYIIPLINQYDSVKDVMRTYTEHSAYQIGKVLNVKETQTLVTGGGVYNTFLIERIKAYSNSTISIPEPKIVNFKEALIFGLLAYLRVQNKVNVLSSVTGACKDSCSGLIAYS